MRTLIWKTAARFGYEIRRIRKPSPQEFFHSPHYLRLNARQLEHFASLGIDVRGTSVLEVGAGIGDHTHYFLDRACRVTITESRAENLAVLRELYPYERVRELDMERPVAVEGTPYEIVYCSGLLYHLSKPAEALTFLAQQCSGMLIVQTCVSFGAANELHPVTEDVDDLTQSMHGGACRPTRPWVFDQLRRHFPCVYCPVTQPNHEEFPLDWNSPEKHRSEKGLQRAIFIASRAPIASELLSPELLDVQKGHS